MKRQQSINVVFTCLGVVTVSFFITAFVLKTTFSAVDSALVVYLGIWLVYSAVFGPLKIFIQSVAYFVLLLRRDLVQVMIIVCLFDRARHVYFFILTHEM